MLLKRRFLSLALSLGLAASLLAQPALAAGETPGQDNPAYTSYGLECKDGSCKLAFDLGELNLSTAVSKDSPLKFDIPQDKVAFLPGGAGVEISDKLAINLPFGNIQITDGDFNLRLDENGKLERFHGTGKTIVPTFNLNNNVQIAGPFSAEFGYDFGSTLGDLSPLLDPAQRYLFLRLGSGFQISATVPGADGKLQSVSFAVPQGGGATLVVDPLSPLIYFDGNMSVLQTADLGFVSSLLAANNVHVPMLSGIALPTRTKMNVAMLISGDMQRNFLQLGGGLSVDGGALARLFNVRGEPLAIDGTLRVDGGGLKINGMARSSVMPDKLLDTGAAVELFVPFTLGKLPYVKVGGDVAVPAAGVAAQGETKIGGSDVVTQEVATTAVVVQESVAETGPSWWQRTGDWMGGVAGSVGQGAQAGLTVVEDVAGASRDVIKSGASAAWDTTASGAGAAAGATTSGAAAVWNGTTQGVACTMSRAQALWCQTTKLCQVPEVVCDDPAQGTAGDK